MGLFDRIKDALSRERRVESTGVEYQCASCGEVFDTAREQCPNCGENDIRERGSFEFRPEGERSTQ